MSRWNAGFTLIEMLIVVAILGVIVAVGFVNLQPATSRVLASDLKAMIHQARYEAVRQNRPVAFVWFEGQNQFETRTDTGSSLAGDACTGNNTLVTKRLAEYPRAEAVINIPTNGVVWLPTGQGRSCTGTPMVSSSIEVSDGRSTRTVEITMGGKVSIE